MNSLFQQQKIPKIDLRVLCNSKEMSSFRNIVKSISLPFDKHKKKKFQKAIAKIKNLILRISFFPPYNYSLKTANTQIQRKKLEHEIDREKVSKHILLYVPLQQIESVKLSSNRSMRTVYFPYQFIKKVIFLLF